MLIEWVPYSLISLGYLWAVIAALSLSYLLFLKIFSFLSGRGLSDVHEAASAFFFDSVVNSSFGKAIGAIAGALVAALSTLFRILVLPVRVLSTSIEALIQGPVDAVLNRFEDKATEREKAIHHRKLTRARRQTKLLIERHRGISELRDVQEIAKSARRVRQLPAFPSQNEQLKHPRDFVQEKRAFAEKEDHIKYVSISNSTIKRQLALLVVQGLKDGAIMSVSVKSVQDYLQCTEERAREVRNYLRDKGVVEEAGNGRVKYLGKSTFR